MDPAEEMTTLLVPAFVHNCSVSVEMFQGGRVLAIGHTSFESEINAIMHAHA